MVNGASYGWVVKPRVSGGRTAIFKALHYALSRKPSEETQMKMEKRETRPLRRREARWAHVPGESQRQYFRGSVKIRTAKWNSKAQKCFRDSCVLSFHCEFAIGLSGGVFELWGVECLVFPGVKSVCFLKSWSVGAIMTLQASLINTQFLDSIPKCHKCIHFLAVRHTLK